MFDDRFKGIISYNGANTKNDGISPSSNEDKEETAAFQVASDAESKPADPNTDADKNDDINKVENTSDDKDDEAESDKNSSTKADESSISSDLIRGHINTIILRALYERDKYGYEIIADIEKKSHGQYTLKQPTLYSALKRLENQGYIKAYWKTDEVSSGGRRKYFTLTENGKEVTETNLAEWEYSRTIIDSLISDRSFDFSQPAPTPVDFTILRDSVSRVPVIKSDEEGRESSEEPSDSALKAEQIEPAQQATAQRQNVAEAEVKEETISVFEDKAAETVNKPTTDTIETDLAAEAERRRIVHENYMKLISAPIREPEPIIHDDIVPGSKNVVADDLLYNNKPEPERDYKNLVDGIYNKAVRCGSVQTSYSRSQPPAQPPRQNSRNAPSPLKIADKGRADGITVAASSDDVNLTYATKTTYNKGLTLFKCSAIVLAITVIEFLLCAIFKNDLKVSWAYPVVILSIGLVQFAVFGILLLRGYGQNCVRPTTNGYISTCVILTVLAVLIICAVSFLLNMNATLASDIVKMIVIPSITAMNLTIFAVFFKLFLK